MFTLEPTSNTIVSEGGEKNCVPRSHAMVMVRWDSQVEHAPFWLSSIGKVKGSRGSVKLGWSGMRYNRDALSLDVCTDRSWMQDCDVVSEHVSKMRSSIIPRVCDLDNPAIATMVCAQTDQMVS